MSSENKIVPTPTGAESPSQPDKLRTKIAAVREQLQVNPNVYFAGELHHYHPGAPEHGYWTETVDIIIAPTTPQFEADGLNTFMSGLIVDVELSSKDDACDHDDGGLALGKLYFDETIGSIRKVTQITIETSEPETILKAKRQLGESQTEWQGEIQRRTWVRVYPDPISAATVYEYETAVSNGTVEPNSAHEYAHHWLDGEQIRQLKEENSKTPISRIKGFLHRGK